MNFGEIKTIPSIDPDYCASLKPHVLSEMQIRLLYSAKELIFDGKNHTISTNVSEEYEGNALVIKMSIDVL